MFVSNDQPTSWQYGVCALDADPQGFCLLGPLAEIWRSKRSSDQAIPDKSTFDFYDSPDWSGRISIAQIEREPFDIRFTLWGTALTEWWGVDYTGKTLGSESITPTEWDKVEKRYFQEMADNPFIGLVTGKLEQHDRAHIRILGLDLPVLTDGRVSHVLSGYVDLPEPEIITATLKNAPIERFMELTAGPETVDSRI